MKLTCPRMSASMADGMGHTYYQNYGHLIYHVYSVELLTEDLPRVHAYMRAVLKGVGVKNPVVGGIEDHIHIFGEFPVKLAVSDVVRQVKTSTTSWLKTTRAAYKRFAWQEGFAYFSVSASLYDRTARYVITQREHHANKTFEQELDDIIARCNNAIHVSFRDAPDEPHPHPRR